MMLLKNIQYSKNKLLFFLKKSSYQGGCIRKQIRHFEIQTPVTGQNYVVKKTSDNTPVMCLPQTNHRFSQLLGAFSPHFLEQRASGKKSCRTSVESRFRQRFWLRALATNSKMGTLAHVLRKKNKPPQKKTVEKRSKKKQRTREPRRKGRRNQEEQEKKQSEREKPSALLEAARSSGGKEEKKEETDRKKRRAKKQEKEKNAQKKKKKKGEGGKRTVLARNLL